MSLVDSLNIQDSLPDEIRKATKHVVLPAEFGLTDKYEIVLADIADSNEEQRLTNQKVEILDLLYKLENREEIKALINDTLEYKVTTNSHNRAITTQ